eukprot:scaffold124252_cov30-Tisochrysis_lutea.AAC.3
MQAADRTRQPAGKARKRPRSRGGRGRGNEGPNQSSLAPNLASVMQLSLSQLASNQPKSAPVPRTASTGTHTKHLSRTRFDQLPISPMTIRGITEVLRYEFLTAVQEATLSVVLQGLDVIAKAKTGTGKTTGFLLPSVEVLVRARAKNPAAANRHVGALIIAPTRELSFQIKKECDELITFHTPHLSSLSITGGTNIASDLKHLRQAVPSVLVATPGRLKDLLLNHGLASLFAELKVLVFDEADQLLDMGFRPDITKILQAIEPSRLTRQTLLYSATLPKDVMEIARIATRGNVQVLLLQPHEFCSFATAAQMVGLPQHCSGAWLSHYLIRNDVSPLSFLQFRSLSLVELPPPTHDHRSRASRNSTPLHSSLTRWARRRRKRMHKSTKVRQLARPQLNQQSF